MLLMKAEQVSDDVRRRITPQTATTAAPLRSDPPGNAHRGIAD
jgi:hypothetical protein